MFSWQEHSGNCEGSEALNNQFSNLTREASDSTLYVHLVVPPIEIKNVALSLPEKHQSWELKRQDEWSVLN